MPILDNRPCSAADGTKSSLLLPRRNRRHFQMLPTLRPLLLGGSVNSNHTVPAMPISQYIRNTMICGSFNFMQGQWPATINSSVSYAGKWHDWRIWQLPANGCYSSIMITMHCSNAKMVSVLPYSAYEVSTTKLLLTTIQYLTITLAQTVMCPACCISNLN